MEKNINNNEIDLANVLSDNYHLLKKLDSIYYLALHSKLNKAVLVKAIKNNFSDSYHLFKEAMICEAKIFKECRHEAFPTLLELIETEDFLVEIFEFVQGNSLMETFSNNEKLDVNTVLSYVNEFIDALLLIKRKGYALPNGFLRPSDIIIRPEMNIAFIDIGYLRKASVYAMHEEYLKKGTVFDGDRSPFLPPEIYTMKLSEASDVYALGVMMYYMLTGGNYPWNQDPPYEYIPLRNVDPNLPRSLERIITCCIKPNPKERIKTLQDMFDLLNPVYSGYPAPSKSIIKRAIHSVKAARKMEEIKIEGK